MALTVVTFVGLMVFGWGMDITGLSSAATTGGELGRVNGEPIFQQEWASAYRNLYDQQQREQPGTPIGAAAIRQIENAAWEQLVMQKLVNQELKRRGIEVTQTEIRQAARFAPPPEFQDNELFKTNGQFDLNKYHQFLSSNAVDDALLAQLEAYYRDVIPRSKLFYQVTSGTYIPESQMWRIWRDARETATIKYLAVDPRRVVPEASITVSEKEIKAYYDDNQDEFKRPASALVRYVTMQRAPGAADSAASLNRARAARQQALTDFAGVAARESSDSISAKQGGLLGKFQRGQMVPAFDQAAFSLPVGQVSEPILTQFGYHIIKVISRTGNEAEAAHILIPIAPSAEAEGLMLDRADSLETLGENVGLEAAAKAIGVTVRQGELNDSTPFLAGVGPADDAAQWLFRDGQAGDVSEVFETPNVYYMVEVASKRDAGLISLSEARNAIQDKLKDKKRTEAALTVARTMVDKIRAGATLEAVGTQAGINVAQAGPFTRLEVVPGLGRANAAIGTAFGLKPGEVSGAVEADGMVFIIQTVAIAPADRAQFDAQKQAARGRMTQALAEQRWTEFLSALKENAKIIDNRAELQRQAAEAAAAGLTTTQ